MQCCGAIGELSCAEGCVNFTPSRADPIICDCGHKNFRHRVTADNDRPLNDQLDQLRLLVIETNKKVDETSKKVDETNKRTRSATPTIDDIDEADDEYVACCIPVHIKYHPNSQEKLEKAKESAMDGQANLRATCTVCKKRTRNYCRACSVTKGSCTVVCGPVKGLAEECWSKHIMKKK